jgi:hypothetical protein
MIAPHKCFLITYLLIAQFVEQIVNLQEIKKMFVAMGMLLHSNEHLQISTVADRLSMFATCGRIPWEAPASFF